MADFPDTGLVQGEGGKHPQQDGRNSIRSVPKATSPLLWILSHHYQDHSLEKETWGFKQASFNLPDTVWWICAYKSITAH